MSSVEETITNRNGFIADGMESFSVDGVVYTGYAKYTFLWERSYLEEPKRNGKGSIENMNEIYASFPTAHLIVDYSVMSIGDYRTMMKQLLPNGKNEFTVHCYDPIYDKMIDVKMYFATPEKPEYYCLANSEGKVELLGVQNYTVELIGTNSDRAESEE